MMTQLFIGLLEPIAARRWLEDYAEGYPGILPCLDELLVLTGTHPYLLRGMGESLQEVERMLPSGAEVGPAHLPLLRLRLAERARPLFETLWRRLQTPPALVQMPVVIALLNRLVQGPLPVAKLSHEESNAVNWIFNLALIALCSDGGRPRAESSSLIAYELFSPLLAEFLRERLSDLHAGYTEAHAAGAASAVSAAAQPANVPPAGVAPAGVPEGSRTAARQEPAPAPVGIAPDVLESLTKIEAALLGYFQSRSNQIITPEQLLRDVWRRPDATVRRVQEAIRRLRLVIDAANPPIGAIENDRGRGYRFVPAPRA